MAHKIDEFLAECPISARDEIHMDHSGRSLPSGGLLLFKRLCFNRFLMEISNNGLMKERIKPFYGLINQHKNQHWESSCNQAFIAENLHFLNLNL